MKQRHEGKKNNLPDPLTRIRDAYTLAYTREGSDADKGRPAHSFILKPLNILIKDLDIPILRREPRDRHDGEWRPHPQLVPNLVF